MTTPTLYQYQNFQGHWCDFIDDQHRIDTEAEGSWPIRALYAAPQACTECVKREYKRKKLTDAGFLKSPLREDFGQGYTDGGPNPLYKSEAHHGIKQS